MKKASVAVLACVVLTIAACSAGVPSPSSVAPSVPIETPTQTDLAPSPTTIPTPPRTPPPVAPTPGPTDTPCPATPHEGDPVVFLYSELNRGQPELKLTAIASLRDPDVTFEPRPSEPDPAVVNFVGGRESFMFLYQGDETWLTNTASITEFNVTVTLDGGAPVGLPRRIEPAYSVGVFITVPDVDATGTIDVQLEIRDACFVYQAELSAPVRVYPSQSVAACPTDSEGGFDEVRDTFEPPLLVAGRAVDLIPTHFAGKVVDLPVIDPLPAYVAFDRDSLTFAAAPGAAISISSTNADVELHPNAFGDVYFYRRGALLRWLEDGWIHGDEPSAPVVFRSPLIELPDGTFTFDAPIDPARYVAHVVFDYDAACSIGRAGFPVGVDVTT